MTAAEYQEYLQSPAWHAKRVRLIYEAHGHCQECGGGGLGQRLDVHHLTYARRGAELDSDLIVLCRECHARRHTEGEA